MHYKFRTNVIIIVLLCLFVQGKAFSQSNTIIWGELEEPFSPAMIFRLEILDRDSQMPIRNAIVKLQVNNRVFSAQSDRDGICIIIFMEKAVQFGRANLKITSNNYRFWEDNFSYFDYKSKIKKHKFRINGMRLDWSGWPRPSFNETINAVQYKNYQIVSPQYHFQGPGIFEKKIFLENLHQHTIFPDQTSQGQENLPNPYSSRERNRENKYDRLFNEDMFFTEKYYYNTEWILKIPSDNLFYYIKFQPGKILYKKDPYLPYNSSDINWWIEENNLCIHLNPDNILYYHITPGSSTLNGNNKSNTKASTLNKL